MRVLFVCTGNICRSPVAERLTTAFAAELGRTDLVAASSGTAAVVDAPMDDRAAAALAGLGADAGAFRARQFTSDHALQADVVLTLTRAHRRDVLQAAPRAMGRSFTLLEAADLLEQLPAGLVLPPATDLRERGTAIVGALAAQRSVRARGPRDADDVQDPVGRSDAVHRAVADQIADALFPLLQTLTGLREPVEV